VVLLSGLRNNDPKSENGFDFIAGQHEERSVQFLRKGQVIRGAFVGLLKGNLLRNCQHTVHMNGISGFDQSIFSVEREWDAFAESAKLGALASPAFRNPAKGR